MKHFKKLLALFLSVLCIVSLFATAGSAQKPETSEDTERNAEPIVQTPAAEQKNDKLIALTFDDGPGANTAKLLDGLKKRGAHCTFFVVGQYAKYYPATIKQCYEDGHQIASHSYTHAWLTDLSDSEIRSEMQKTSDAVSAAIGCNLTLMVRPPYGAYNSHVLDVLGVPAFYWSDDSGDWWSGATADSVYNNTIKTAGDGDILLLHDSHSWSCEAAIRIVDKLQAEGYEFVTLSELFRRRGVKLEAGHIYSWLRANGTNLPGVAKPVIQMAPTAEGMQITMQSEPGTKICYTTDGSVPNAASNVYTGPFVLTQAVKLTAVAGYDMNGSRSERVTVDVPKLRACDTPVITVEDGYAVITAQDPVYYTLDGTEPELSSEPYTEPVPVEPGTVIRAFAYAADENTVKSPTVFLYYSENGNLFNDVLPNNWFAGDVDRAVSAGLMVGTAENHFAPDMTVSRAQLVTALHRFSGEDAPEAETAFDDVPQGSWYEDAVLWAEANGIVVGYDDGLFHPNDAVTREQTAAVLCRFAAYLDYDTSETASPDAFSDGASTSAYAKRDMGWAVNTGLFCGTGDGRLTPQATLTRAQLASLLIRFGDLQDGWEEVHLTDDELLALANEILPLLSEMNIAELTKYVNPKSGLTFTPFSSAGEADRTISLRDLVFQSKTKSEAIWGSWDGSGEAISMRFPDYWNRFVWNADYLSADRVTPNEITVSGTAIENVREFYGDCLFVEYAIDSLNGYEDGTDWTTLKLVFCRYEKQWYLTGLIHGEWTP